MTFIVTGAIGTTVAISPDVWLDMFTDEAGPLARRGLFPIAGPFMRYLAPDRRSISQARDGTCPLARHGLRSPVRRRRRTRRPRGRGRLGNYRRVLGCGAGARNDRRWPSALPLHT